MYGSVIYYLSKVAIEMPILILLPLVEILISFWGIEYRQEAFFEFYFVAFLTVQVGTSLGLLISCLFDEWVIACQTALVSVYPSVLLGGMIVNLGTLESWRKWLQYTSPTRFAFEAVLRAQWPNDEM